MAREVEAKIVFTTDDAQKQKALKAYDALVKAQKNVSKESLASGKSFKDTAKQLDIINKDIRDVTKSLDAMDGKWRDNVDGAETLEQQIKRLNDTFDETSQKVGSFGDIQANLGAGGALLGAAGLGGAESALSLGGEGAALLEELPRLKDAFKAAGPAVQVTSEALGLTAVTGKLAGFGLGATAASLVAISTVILPLVALAGGLAFAWDALKKKNEEMIAITLAQLDAQAEVNDLFREGVTSSEFLEQRNQAERDFQKTQEDLAATQAEYNRVIEEGGPLTKLLGANEQALFERIQEQEGAVRDATIKLGEYNDRMFDSELTINDNTEALEGLNQERQTAVQESDRLAATLGQFAERRAQLTEQNAINEQNALENEALASKFAKEDDLAQVQEHFDNLADIASEGREKIAVINAELSALPKERLEKLGDVEREGNDKLSKLRTDFFDKSNQKLANFQKETAKIETASAVKRLRAAQDAQLAQDDAQRENNVIAFLKSQRDSETRLQRGIEDEQTAEQTRVQNFIDAQQQERDAFQAKQAEIQAGIQLERESVNASFTERRENLLAAIELERAANEASVEAEKVRFQENEAREEQQADRQRQRDELRDSQQERAHQRKLAQIQEEENLASQAHQQSLARIQEIDRAIQSIQPPPAATQSSSRGTSSRGTSSSQQSGGLLGAISRFGQRSANTGSSGRSGFTPFHGGGEVDFKGGQKEGFIYAQDGEIVTTPDKIGSPIPFQNNGTGSNASGGRGSQPIIVTVQDNRTVQVGDIATVSAVTEALNGSNKAIIDNIYKMVEGAIA